MGLYGRRDDAPSEPVRRRTNARNETLALYRFVLFIGLGFTFTKPEELAY
jgi:hypothetical protein